MSGAWPGGSCSSVLRLVIVAPRITSYLHPKEFSVPSQRVYIIVYCITSLPMRVLLIRFHCQSMRANSIIDITVRIASRSTSN